MELQSDIMVGNTVFWSSFELTYSEHDVFGNEENATIKYKTLSWQLVAVLMIAEIVSNGMLSLPAALAVVGIVPGIILIAFSGYLRTLYLTRPCELQAPSPPGPQHG